MKPWRFSAEVANIPSRWPSRVELRALREDGRVVVKPMFGTIPLLVGDWIVAGKDGVRHVVSAEDYAASQAEKPKKAKK